LEIVSLGIIFFLCGDSAEQLRKTKRSLNPDLSMAQNQKFCAVQWVPEQSGADVTACETTLVLFVL
jgi:hypothetical protein